MTDEATTPLCQKLAAVCKALPELEKQGDNGEYTFLRAFDVFKAFRRQLFQRGISIVPVKIVEVVRFQPYLTVNDNMIDEYRVTVQYSISDGEQEILGEGIGVGQDYQGKALYMALTGSLKFFVQAIGLIAGIPDDPENVNEGPIPPGLAEKLDEMEKKFGPDMREHPISQRDVRAFTSACHKSGIRVPAQKHFLKQFNVDKISDLKRKDFPAALKWALEDLPPEAP